MSRAWYLLLLMCFVITTLGQNALATQALLSDEPRCLIFEHEVNEQSGKSVDNAMRYDYAIKDALTIDDDELLPLVSLKKDSPLVSFDEQGRVLLLTMHSYPDSYIAGSEFALKFMSWTFTDKEFISWFEKNFKGVSDWQLRMHQLLGMPQKSKHTHITAMWADPKYVIRPAYRTDVFNSDCAKSFSDAQETTAGIQNYIDLQNNSSYGEHAVHAGMSIDEYQQWFNENIISSYFSEDDYPWTRLGYTYDWYYALSEDGNNGSREYGLSEFLIPKHTMVKIAYTLKIDDFIAMISKDLAKSK